MACLWSFSSGESEVCEVEGVMPNHEADAWPRSGEGGLPTTGDCMGEMSRAVGGWTLSGTAPSERREATWGRVGMLATTAATRDRRGGGQYEGLFERL